jgi:hypothetical protein
MTSPVEHPGEQPRDLLAILFDIRSFTGGLFLILGVIVTIVGLNASDADIEKAAGLNLSLIVGVIMIVAGAGFIAWLLLSPPQLLEAHEMTEDDLPEQLRHHGLEAIPEHHGEAPPEEQPPPPRRRPRGH